MNNLKKVTIGDYQNLKGKFRPWLLKEKIPAFFWEKIEKTNTQISVEKLLYKIDKELMNCYGKKRDTACSFSDSRFSSISQILKRGMVSCGALSRIHTAVLRNLGIPVKLVHSKLKGQKGENRHSWLKIYNPHTKRWIDVDPTQDRRGFKIINTARQIKIYSNWNEMKEDYRLGRF